VVKEVGICTAGEEIAQMYFTSFDIPRMALLRLRHSNKGKEAGGKEHQFLSDLGLCVQVVSTPCRNTEGCSGRLPNRKSSAQNMVSFAVLGILNDALPGS